MNFQAPGGGIPPQFQTPKRQKYANRKCEADGYKFDSAKEMRYYHELKLRCRVAAENIRYFRVHPTYLLSETIRHGKITSKRRSYTADFEITYNDGRIEVVDVKGFDSNGNRYRDDAYSLRRHFFLQKYGWAIWKFSEI